ncbi:hypothetical protein CZ771_01340 [Actinomycetales bacterium JB111]|nr:hypothetical protein CZ771_01340 [Actinomycetales bacterium JB111]
MPEPAKNLFADTGSVLSFRTLPLHPVSPEPTGRYAAAVVIGRTARIVVLAPLAEVWTEPPSLTGEAWQIARGTAKTLSDHIEERWRWRHEPQQMRSEQVLEQERRRREAEEKERRMRTRLRTLTFARLLEEPLLEDWEPSPPFPPAFFRDAVAQLIRETQRKLDALGPKPRIPVVRTAMVALAGRIYEAEAAAPRTNR